jgi:tetratricopeptide (TPR) repeat protein
VTTHEIVEDCAQQAGNLVGISTTLNNLGLVYRNQGKLDDAIDCYEQSLEISRRLGDDHGVGQTLANLGIIHKQRNQTEQALTCLHPSSAEFQTVQQWLEIPLNLRWVNYLLPLAVGGFILFCLVKGYWLLEIFGVAIILFCLGRSIFRRNYDLSD